MTTKSVMISFLAAIILNIKMEITRNSVLSLILDLAGWWVQDLLQPFTSITGISPPLSWQCIAMRTWFPWVPRQQNIMVYVKHRAVREDEISVKKNESVTILSSNLSRGYLVHRPSTAQVPFQTHKINIHWLFQTHTKIDNKSGQNGVNGDCGRQFWNLVYKYAILVEKLHKEYNELKKYIICINFCRICSFCIHCENGRELSQVTKMICGWRQPQLNYIIVRVRRLRAGCHPIVFISLGQRPGNLQPGHSGFLPLFLWRASA